MSGEQRTRPIAARSVEPTGNAKLDAYDAACLCLERNRDAFECIRVLLNSDLWPSSAEAFDQILRNQVDFIDETLPKIKALDPSKAIKGD